MSEVAASLDTVVSMMELRAELALKHGLDFQQRSFWILGEITDKMLKHVDACMGLLEQDNSKSITVRINSTGGEVYAGMAIISRLRNSKCKVKTEGHGACMSMAAVILAAGHKRSFSRLASFMWHEPQGAVVGRDSEIDAWVEQGKLEYKRTCEFLASVSNKDAEFWSEQGRHTDKFYTAETLVELGIVDKIF